MYSCINSIKLCNRDVIIAENKNTIIDEIDETKTLKQIDETKSLKQIEETQKSLK